MRRISVAQDVGSGAPVIVEFGCYRGKPRPSPLVGLPLVRLLLAARTLAVGALSITIVLLGLRVAKARADGLLPDGRAYEMVSPVQKNGGLAGALTEGEGAELHFIPDYSLASSDGSGLLYGSDEGTGSGVFGTSNSGVDLYSLSRRTATGWATRAVVPPANGQASILSDSPHWLLPSSDLSQSAFVAGASFGSAPPNTVASIYVAHEDESISWVGRPSIPNPLNGELSPLEDLRTAGASRDLSKIYFLYPGTL